MTTPPAGSQETTAPPPKHVRPAAFRPHSPAQVTQTAGMNPDPPADHSAAPDIATVLPYAGAAPTGYAPMIAGTY